MQRRKSVAATPESDMYLPGDPLQDFIADNPEARGGNYWKRVAAIFQTHYEYPPNMLRVPSRHAMSTL